jgi:regulator of protease activity HflC (stomatin/prohibitin superfamily)
MKQQDGFINVTTAFLVVSAIVVIGGLAFGLPQYNVWTKTLNGKALLQEQEYVRQVKVLEAKALKDAAALQAEAEVERAKGAAAANKILGESLKGNSEYLQYLYIQNLENSDNSKEKTVIYVPTERGIPIPITESQRLK